MNGHPPVLVGVALSVARSAAVNAMPPRRATGAVQSSWRPARKDWARASWTREAAGRERLGGHAGGVGVVLAVLVEEATVRGLS